MVNYVAASMNWGEQCGWSVRICSQERGQPPYPQKFTTHDTQNPLQQTPHQEPILSWCSGPCPPPYQGATSQELGAVFHGSLAGPNTLILLLGTTHEGQGASRGELMPGFQDEQTRKLTQKSKEGQTLEDVGRLSHGEFHSLQGRQ